MLFIESTSSEDFPTVTPLTGNKHTGQHCIESLDRRDGSTSIETVTPTRMPPVWLALILMACKKTVQTAS